MCFEKLLSAQIYLQGVMKDKVIQNMAVIVIVILVILCDLGSKLQRWSLQVRPGNGVSLLLIHQYKS